jgi:hypothetical protein
MSDITIQQAKIPLPATNPKPSYLITISNKNKQKYFVTINKPDLSASFIACQGAWIDKEEEFIISNHSQLLTSTPKELILEMFFPWHSIISIRSLIFKAK